MVLLTEAAEGGWGIADTLVWARGVRSARREWSGRKTRPQARGARRLMLPTPPSLLSAFRLIIIDRILSSLLPEPS
jgi:hypothetical protein